MQPRNGPHPTLPSHSPDSMVDGRASGRTVRAVCLPALGGDTQANIPANKRCLQQSRSGQGLPILPATAVPVAVPRATEGELERAGSRNAAAAWYTRSTLDPPSSPCLNQHCSAPWQAARERSWGAPDPHAAKAGCSCHEQVGGPATPLGLLPFALGLTRQGNAQVQRALHMFMSACRQQNTNTNKQGGDAFGIM